MTSVDWWVMLTAVLCAVPCAVLGCFLVLRRMSLLGDAISHAVLPGLVMGFILTGTRDVGAMLAGAAAAGVLTAFLSGAINRWGRVDEGASLGVVFSSMFALGVVLITLYARNVDIDPGCVLYGIIEGVPFNTTSVLGFDIPKATLTLAVTTVLVCGLVAVFFKELRIVSFDAPLATTLGISAGLVHYALLGAVAGTAVASFEAVGSILVVTMLVAPAATAQLLTDRLGGWGGMVLVAALIGILDAVVGHLLAIWIDTSVPGMMSVVAGAVFVIVALGSPRHGVIAKAMRRAMLSVRIAEEDALGRLFRAAEGTGHPPQAPGISEDGWAERAGLRRLRRRGLVGPGGAITGRGMEAARAIVRSHRLWESYLARHTDLPLDHLHGPSERVEHFISGAMREELAKEAEAGQDPHGREIPRV